MSRQYALVAKTANGLQDWMRESIGSRLRKVILPFCLVLVRSYLECCIQHWGPQYKTYEHSGASSVKGHKDD